MAALLDAAAPIDARDESGLTALQIAVRWDEQAVAELLVARGADPKAVGHEDRAFGDLIAGRVSAAPAGVTLERLDEMVMGTVEGGHADALGRLLDAGARVDGNPGSGEIPLGHACWRGRVEITRELMARGAVLRFRDGGSAVGAALHGSRRCQHPEGRPTMQLVEEIATEPYAEILRMLLAAGAPVPDRIGDHGPRATTLMAELGCKRRGEGVRWHGPGALGVYV